MPLVYRIEDKSGSGPYMSGKGGQEIYDDAANDGKSHGESDGRPNPYKDSLPNTPGYMYFGFESLSQLTRWFDSENGRIALSDVGFRVSVYESDNVDYGSSQVRFEKRTATLVDTINLREIKNE